MRQGLPRRVTQTLRASVPGAPPCNCEDRPDPAIRLTIGDLASNRSPAGATLPAVSRSCLQPRDQHPQYTIVPGDHAVPVNGLVPQNANEPGSLEASPEYRPRPSNARQAASPGQYLRHDEIRRPATARRITKQCIAVQAQPLLRNGSPALAAGGRRRQRIPAEPLADAESFPVSIA